MRDRRRFDKYCKKIKARLPQLKTFLLACLVFFLPTNLFVKFFENQSYVNGLQIDYLLVKIYLSDILILLLLLVWLIEKYCSKKLKLKFWQKNSQKKTKKFLLALALFVLLLGRQILTHKAISALFYLAKLGEMLVLFNFLKQHSKLFKKSLVQHSFLAALIAQSGLAIYQFTQQKSLYGFCFFGETQLNNFYGIAKASFAGNEKILPYATTAHPNILAGFLVIYTLIYFQLTKTKLWLESALLSLSGLIIYLTQSWSAALVLSLGLLILMTKHKLGWLKKKHYTKTILLCLILAAILATFGVDRLAAASPGQLSLTRRAALQKAAWKMFWYHPLIGVGLNNFTANLENYTNNHLLDNFVQPVHHLPLLVLAENGIFNLLLIGNLIKLNLKKKLKSQKLLKLGLIFLPLIILDHYLLTNQVGLLILVFSLSLL